MRAFKDRGGAEIHYIPIAQIKPEPTTVIRLSFLDWQTILDMQMSFKNMTLPSRRAVEFVQGFKFLQKSITMAGYKIEQLAFQKKVGWIARNINGCWNMLNSDLLPAALV